MNDSHTITPSVAQMEEARQIFSTYSARVEALRSLSRAMARQAQIDAVIEIARALGVEVKQ